MKNANKRFNTTGHDYEISLSNDCTVDKANIEIEKPKFVLKAVGLDKIVSLVGTVVDVFAVVDKVDPLQSVSLFLD